MLTNKSEIKKFPAYIMAFKGITQTGVVVHVGERCIFTVLSGPSFLGRKSIQTVSGLTAFVIRTDSTGRIAFLVQDRGLRDQFGAVNFAEKPLRVGDKVNIVASTGTLSAQVIQHDFYRNENIDLNAAPVRTIAEAPIAEAPKAKLHCCCPSDMYGSAVFDTITGDLRGFVGFDPSRGCSTVNDVFYLHKLLQEAIDKFKEYFKGFLGQSVSDVLVDPTKYDAMRRQLASSHKTLGIDTVYDTAGDILMIAGVPKVVDNAGNFIETEYHPTEVSVDTAANKNKKFMTDYNYYKDTAIGRIILVNYTDFITEEKITMGAWWFRNGADGANGITAGDFVDGNGAFSISMKTAIDIALSRYKPGTPIIAGVEFRIRTGEVERKVYLFDGLDEKTTDLINGTAVQRSLSDVSNLVQINEPKYLALIPGTTYLSISDLQAAIVTVRGDSLLRQMSLLSYFGETHRSHYFNY